MMEWRKAGCLAALTLGTVACHSCDEVVILGGGGAGAGSTGDGATDTTGSFGGETACRTEHGFEVCGGDAQCACEEGACYDQLCINLALTEFPNLPAQPCPDGAAYYLGDSPLLCIPFELALKFCENGQSELVRFNDLGTFDCEPLPTPSDCPTPPGITLCGESCGSCAPGEACHGRSRLHPYSMCVSLVNDCRFDNPDMCGAGEGCFIYTVDEAAQPAADRYAFCLPLAQCQAAAAGLPGGGVCLEP